jgi:hypothetical protein
MQGAIHTRIAPNNSSIRRNNDCALRGLAQFAAQRARAIEHYVAFVHEGTRAPTVWSELQGQIYLEPKAFIEKMQTLVDKSRRSRKSRVRNAARQNGHWPNLPARTSVTKRSGWVFFWAAYDERRCGAFWRALHHGESVGKGLRSGSKSIECDNERPDPAPSDDGVRRS